MKYFKYFPKTVYYSENVNENITVTDIFKSINIKFDKNNFVNFTKYYIQDGDRPDTISYFYYGDTKYHWLILLINDIVDMTSDWPLTTLEFESFIIQKYGSIDLAKSTISSYSIIVNGKYLKVNQETYQDTPTSARSIKYAYDYEQEINESKKNIVLLRKDLVVDAYNQLKKTFK